MLTEIRDRSSGWFAWIIAALIIIPMAFFGVQQYASTEARPTIIEVGDQKINQQEYQSRLAQAQNQARSNNPSLANSDVLNSEFYKKQVLQGMVDRAVTQHVAGEYNYQFGDDQIDKAIREAPNFQTDGKFDQKLYEIFAASRGNAGAAQIRGDIQQNSRLQQVVSGYQESALVLPNEVRDLLEIQSEQRSFEIITIKQADYREKVVVSDADIDAYYQANIDQFMLPDRVSVSYLELDKAVIAENAVVDSSAVQAAYDEYKNGFVSDETRNTRHILRKLGADEDENEQKAKIEDLAKQLAAGADFAELAKTHSQDPGSAANGGSLGNVERGQMVAEFDEVTFELTEGQISEPVKTQFGYHIIQVEKIDATKPDSFESLSFELEQEERERIADELVIEQAEQLRNSLFEQPDSLDQAAEELGLKVNLSSLFDRGVGTGIAENESVRAAAFSDVVLNENANSELIETADGVYVALCKKQFAASEPKKLSAVTAAIKTTLIDERSTAAAKAAGDSVLAKAEQDWASLADDESVEIVSHTVSMIDTNRKVGGDVMREVIKMRLDNGDAAVTSFTGTTGDFNIVRLRKIAPGNLAAVSQQVKDATRGLIEQRNGQALVGAYVKGLQQELDVEVNEDLL